MVFRPSLPPFPPVHRDGHKFIAVAAVATVLLFLIWSPLGVIGAMVTAALAFFFRDPERITPIREGLIVAPADGLVLPASPGDPPAELGLGAEPFTCLSVFLSLLDIHVLRAPVSGRVAVSIHRAGAYHHAGSPEAHDENERQGIVIETDAGGKVAVVLVAGYVARRIVTFVKPGDRITAGDRIGLIRFGSRADLYIPGTRALLAAEGQHMIAGETVVADLAAVEPAPAFRRN